jgi:hypothetical protein
VICTKQRPLRGISFSLTLTRVRLSVGKTEEPGRRKTEHDRILAHMEERDIIVRRPVWEMAQRVEKDIDRIRGSFERTVAERDWLSAYAGRQAQADEEAGRESEAQLWRAVERYFVEMEVADADATVRVIED